MYSERVPPHAAAEPPDAATEPAASSVSTLSTETGAANQSAHEGSKLGAYVGTNVSRRASVQSEFELHVGQ